MFRLGTSTLGAVEESVRPSSTPLTISRHAPVAKVLSAMPLRKESALSFRADSARSIIIPMPAAIAQVRPITQEFAKWLTSAPVTAATLIAPSMLMAEMPALLEIRDA